MPKTPHSSVLCWKVALVPHAKRGGDIQSQIKRLEEEIIKLKEKHHALRATMNSNHDPFIHTFPPEISSYTFRLSRPKLDFGELYPWPKRREVTRLLRLGAVCRKWRQLAWVTPNFWEILYLHINKISSQAVARFSRRIAGSIRGASLDYFLCR